MPPLSSLAVTLLSLCALTAALPARASVPATRRIAVLVGANAPPPGRSALRFAHDDASELAAVLQQVGGFPAADVHVLSDPRPAELLSTLDDVARGLGSPDALFVFYYSGHSDGLSLYPHGDRLAIKDVSERVDRIGARIRVGILDTCRGGSWTHSKGLSVGPPLATADLLNVDTEGTALIASSSGFEDAHEADSVHGSFFSHHFSAGLRGAADRERDGNVTLQEAFDYARERTVRDSARLAQEPQHPSFDLALRGRQDIVLAVMPTHTSSLDIAAARGPIEVIQLPSGVTMADAASGQGGLRVALPPGRYLVRTVVDGHVLAREVEVRAGETMTLAEGQLEATGSDQLAMKGDRALDLRLTAVVHVDAGRAVVLERSERGGPWTAACSAPCDQELPLSSLYRISGSGVRDSTPFQLTAQPGEHVTLHVDAATTARFTIGFVLIGAGGVSASVGALVLQNKALEASGYGPTSDNGPSKLAGEIMMGGGAAAILGGVWLVATNKSSKLEQSPPPQPPGSDAWLRLPTWHEDGTGAAMSRSTTTVPLLHGEF